MKKQVEEGNLVEKLPEVISLLLGKKEWGYATPISQGIGGISKRTT